MAVNLKGSSFLTLLDFSPDEIRYLLDLSHDLKSKKRSGILGNQLQGKNIVIIFEKTSTRTRCAFETAVYDEGGNVTFLTNSQMGKKESIEDTAKVLGRFYDGIEYRGFKQETVEKLAKYSGVPVWNGLTDLYHPTQILADLLTMEEHISKPLNKQKLVYMGDARNNMGNSLMIGCAKLGIDFTAVAPKELFPTDEMVNKCKKIAEYSGSNIELTDSVDKGVVGADVLYTDVWVSMGEEDQMAARAKMLAPYKLTMDTIKKTGNEDTIFMHCLPAYHDEETETYKNAKKELGVDIREVSDELFRSRHSVVFDQAENRMHTIKAIMVSTAGR